MSDERYSPLMLTSEHKRILGDAQKRYDKDRETLYQRGRWDGVAVGMLSGICAGIVLAGTFVAIVQGYHP